MSRQPVRFAGYAAVFGKRDSGGDTIVPGAFAATLAARRAAGARLPLFWQHRPDQQIGWIESAEEDERGLRVIAEVTATDTAAARALVRGAVNGLSFGFRVRDGQVRSGGRELRAVDLFEVSLVSRPMQPLARIHMVSAPPDATQ